MSEAKSFYIVPCHNKQNMISEVLSSITRCHDSSIHERHIICILDGCTDGSESLVSSFAKENENVHVLFESNIHEIGCLNRGLRFIQENLSPSGEDLVFTIQDDVILEEEQINKKFQELFSLRDDFGYVSMRLGVSVFKADGELKERGYVESEFGHWKQLNWNFHTNVNRYSFMESEVAVRSPTCTQWKRFEEIGFFDENLRPCGFDCHDFSIRMRKAGYKNGVFALKFRSDVDWGTMRSKTPSSYADKIAEVYGRNRKYIAEKHKDYFGG